MFYKGGLDLKKSLICICILLLVVVVVVLFWVNRGNNQLVYEFEHSYFHEFYSKDDYIVFKDDIKVKNTHSKDLLFNMYADVKEDSGLVAEKTAIACEKESIQKKVFFIKAKSEQVYQVYFKAKKGTKETKENRLPPKKINFKILD